MIKFSTHLCITTDLVMGEAKTDNCVHEIEATIFDEHDEAISGWLNMWAREAPEEGLYQAVNVPMSTHPIRLSVADTDGLRKLPDGLDDAEHSGGSLPVILAYLTSMAVVEWIDADKKVCILTGFTYLNRTHGWQKFRYRAYFEDVMRYKHWTVPTPRSLVHAECVFRRIGEDGLIEAAIRRIAVVEKAPQQLLQALDIGQPKSGDRAARVRDIKAQRATAKRTKAEGASEPTPMDPPESSEVLAVASAPPVTPPVFKAAQEDVLGSSPSSPTVGLLTRKRARAE
ncbi:hypothetical protein OC844_006333 [Tilletia horrida]|nr:hypothetical protein OC844_006333 [Tilletia horrida]